MRTFIGGLIVLLALPGFAHSQIGNLGGSLKPKTAPPATRTQRPAETPAPPAKQPPARRPARSQQMPSPAAKVLDRTDPVATALASLAAYQNRDMSTLSDLAVADYKEPFTEVAQQQEKHPAYEKLFSGRFWDAAQAFQAGQPLDVRYLNFKTVAIAFTGDKKEVIAVSLEWENGKWCFETIKPIDRGVFEARSEQRPAEIIEKAPRSKQDHNDRFDPIATAEACLSAYKLKDTQRLASLGNSTNQDIFLEIFKRGASHPRYKSIFSGWRNDKVQKWNRSNYVAQLRYPNRNTALVSFDLDFAEFAQYVVVLEWENDRWCFEDIQSYEIDKFSELPQKRPQE